MKRRLFWCLSSYYNSYPGKNNVLYGESNFVLFQGNNRNCFLAVMFICLLCVQHFYGKEGWQWII